VGEVWLPNHGLVVCDKMQLMFHVSTAAVKVVYIFPLCVDYMRTGLKQSF